MKPGEENRSEKPLIDASSAISILKDSIKAVPAVRYAYGVLGIVCVAAIIGQFHLNILFAALCVFIILGLMFGLLLFSYAVKQPHTLFKIPALVMIWIIVCAFIMMLYLIVSCVFWKYPLDYPTLVAQFSTNPNAAYESTIKNLNDEIAMKDKWAEDDKYWKQAADEESKFTIGNLKQELSSTKGKLDRTNKSLEDYVWLSKETLALITRSDIILGMEPAKASEINNLAVKLDANLEGKAWRRSLTVTYKKPIPSSP